MSVEHACMAAGSSRASTERECGVAGEQNDDNGGVRVLGRLILGYCGFVGPIFGNTWVAAYSRSSVPGFPARAAIASISSVVKGRFPVTRSEMYA